MPGSLCRDERDGGQCKRRRHAPAVSRRATGRPERSAMGAAWPFFPVSKSCSIAGVPVGMPRSPPHARFSVCCDPADMRRRGRFA
ncbi:hypothetical protein F3J12_04660 [Burkholderia sp. Ax-1735]|nr:hypothetical protein [Burkholderia sp. Ap-955]NIF08862.1 hypothetical protein [Burkholderia sp. Ax-1735]NIG02893.1 hypothetical protein [Burkholderia sp. Tr-849]